MQNEPIEHPFTQIGQTSFQVAINEIFCAIEHCLDGGLVIPAQMLIFSAFDAFSYIEFSEISDARARFEKWINIRILPHEGVVCSATDLYAARSAVLHRLGLSSRLSESGKASKICFCYGSARFEVLVELRRMLRNKSNITAPIVRMESLYEALKKGVADLLKKIDSDPHLQKRMQTYWRNEQPARVPTARK